MTLRHLLIVSILSVFTLSLVGCGESEPEVDLDELFAELEGELDDLKLEAELPENANEKMELSTTFDVEGLSHSVNFYLDNWANPEDVFGFETADEGFKLIALNVTVTNNGEEELEASQLYYTLDFGGNALSEHSYYGSTAPNITRFESATLAAGESYTGDFLFDVPTESAAADWTLVYNSDPFDFQEGYEPTRVGLK